MGRSRLLLVLLTIWSGAVLTDEGECLDRDEEPVYRLEDRREPVRPRPRPALRPDLTITQLSQPVRTGANYQVTVTVKNQGQVPAGPSYVLLYDNNASIGTSRQISSLSGGQSLDLTFTLSSPEDQTTCYLSAIADYGNSISESNEGNNVMKFYGQWH